MGIEQISISRGSHSDIGTTGHGSMTDVVSYLNGDSVVVEQSPCVCFTIRPVIIFLNNLVNDAERQQLVPYILRVMNTATDDRDVLGARFAALTQYAESNARIAAEYAAKVSLEAEQTINMYKAEYPTKSAYSHNANYRFEYADECAKSSADAAARCLTHSISTPNWAALSAMHAASTARYSVDFSANMSALFRVGLAYLDKVCPVAIQPNQEIKERINRLIELAAAK